MYGQAWDVFPGWISKWMVFGEVFNHDIRSSITLALHFQDPGKYQLTTTVTTLLHGWCLMFLTNTRCSLWFKIGGLSVRRPFVTLPTHSMRCTILIIVYRLCCTISLIFAYDFPFWRSFQLTTSTLLSFLRTFIFTAFLIRYFNVVYDSQSCSFTASYLCILPFIA